MTTHEWLGVGPRTRAAREPVRRASGSSATTPAANATNPWGFVHSVESGGTVDGPGVRFVVFLAGCPLACQYCHNPDSRKLHHGRGLSVGTLLDEIRRYRSVLRLMGGGVTISGGEPLVQPRFAEALLTGCQAMGLHTALDTSGYMFASDRLLDAVDLVLLDIKSGLPEVYRRVTGVELAPTVRFAERLQVRGIPVWLRFVLVPGLTDGADNIDALCRQIERLDNIQRLDVLPFHKLGESKWEQLGLAYNLGATPEPTAEQVEAARSRFAKTGVPVY